MRNRLLLALKYFLRNFPPLNTVLWRIPTKEKVVYITIDDGPTEKTPEILEILRAHSVKVSFFMIGSRILMHEDIVSSCIREGHDVFNHSFSHNTQADADSDTILAEFKKTQSLIHVFAPKTLRCFRPPYGVLTLNLLVIALIHRLTVVMWSINPKDYEIRSAQELTERVKAFGLDSGAIILLHDKVHGLTLTQTLPALLDYIKGSGYECRPLSKQLAQGKTGRESNAFSLFWR